MLKSGNIPILRFLIRTVGRTKASKLRQYREIVLSERTISTDKVTVCISGPSCELDREKL